MNASVKWSGLARHSWMVFFGLGILFAVYSGYAFTLPYFQPTHWDWLTGGAHYEYFRHNFTWIGFISSGLALLTLFISATSYRRGEKWAWWVFWYWVVFLLLNTLSEWPGILFLPLLLLALSAQLISYRLFFPQ